MDRFQRCREEDPRIGNRLDMRGQGEGEVDSGDS